MVRSVWKLILIGSCGALLLGLGLWWLLFLRGFGAATLATGQNGGTYQALGDGLAEYVNEREGRVSLETLGSEGTVENLELLEKREVDFAIIQSGYVATDQVRVVAKLYTEVLHVMVREGDRDWSLADLKEKRVSLGEQGSGSRMVGLQLLEHFGVSDYSEHVLSPEESVKALKNNEVDAVFLVSAIQSKVVRDAVAAGGVDFLNLGQANAGLVARFPDLVVTQIPAMTYRCSARAEGAMPAEAISTVGVNSLLVCHRAVEAGMVYEVTRSLLAGRSELSQVAPEAYQISEVSGADLLPWPVHEGAQRYYRRRDPSFLERYSDVMAFLISLTAASWAVWKALSRWTSRTKKNRIDYYYLEVAAAFVRLDEEELSHEILMGEQQRLRNLRTKAFRELANERLAADDSFGIFQDQLALCLDEVRRRKERVAPAER